MPKRKDSPSAAVKIRVMKRDRFQCTYCGAPGTDAELEIDHIIPVAKGGSHHMSNLTTACRKCNQSKSDGDAPESHGPSSSRNGLIGMYFLTYNDDEKVEYQGKVIGVDGDMCVVQTYSWFDGTSSVVRGFSKEFIYSDKVKLFTTGEQMVLEYELFDRIETAKAKEKARFDAQVKEAVDLCGRPE